MQRTTFDQCRVGLKTPKSLVPLRKRTTFMHNMSSAHVHFKNLKCTCKARSYTMGGKVLIREHARIEGSEGGITLSKHVQCYPDEMVDVLATVTKKHIAEMDAV